MGAQDAAASALNKPKPGAAASVVRGFVKNRAGFRPARVSRHLQPGSL
jgi:hypothetical protein